MRICNYKRAGLVLLLPFFHVKSLAAPYYRLKSTKPLLWYGIRKGMGMVEGKESFKVGGR